MSLYAANAMRCDGGTAITRDKLCTRPEKKIEIGEQWGKLWALAAPVLVVLLCHSTPAYPIICCTSKSKATLPTWRSNILLKWLDERSIPHSRVE